MIKSYIILLHLVWFDYWEVIMNVNRFSFIIYLALAIISISLSYTMDKPYQYFSSLFFGIFGNVFEFLVIMEVLKYINRKQ